MKAEYGEDWAQKTGGPLGGFESFSPVCDALSCRCAVDRVEDALRLVQDNRVRTAASHVVVF